MIEYQHGFQDGFQAGVIYERSHAESKHGRWEFVYYDNIPTFAHCSRCDQVLRITRENETMPNYCPYCGARMDESTMDQVKPTEGIKEGVTE